ncbi:hypothetical protein [Pseudonocardia acaciae]|nr:hypothetical protein [Pseudonocardia acaciae]
MERARRLGEHPRAGREPVHPDDAGPPTGDHRRIADGGGTTA